MLVAPRPPQKTATRSGSGVPDLVRLANRFDIVERAHDLGCVVRQVWEARARREALDMQGTEHRLVLHRVAPASPEIGRTGRRMEPVVSRHHRPGRLLRIEREDFRTAETTT